MEKYENRQTSAIRRAVVGLIALVLAATIAIATIDWWMEERAEATAAAQVAADFGGSGVSIEIDDQFFLVKSLSDAPLDQVELRADSLTIGDLRLTSVEAVASNVLARRPFPMTQIEFAATVTDGDLSAAFQSQTGQGVEIESDHGDMYLLDAGGNRSAVSPTMCARALCLELSGRYEAPGDGRSQGDTGKELLHTVTIPMMDDLGLRLPAPDRVVILNDGLRILGSRSGNSDDRLFVYEPELP